MKIFILDYDVSIYEYYKIFFKAEFPKIEVFYFRDNREFLNKIAEGKPELVLAEYDIESPIEIYRNLLENQIPFIITTRIQSERLIVELLKLGAYDFIQKQNFKLDYLKKIIARALLDALRWHQIQDFKKQLSVFPEFEKYDKELKEIAFDKFKIGNYDSPPLPFFENGVSYKVNFLTIRLPITNEMSSLYSEESVIRYHSLWMGKIIEELKKFKCEILIYKNDAITSVFHYQNYIEPIIASLRIKIILFHILSGLELTRLDYISCIEQGTFIYQSNVSNLYSEAINFSHHLIEKINLYYNLFITENVYKNLPNRVRSYFFKTDKFENIDIYYFDYVS